MRAGRLDRRVALQSYAVPTGVDPTAGTYTTTATVWAERMDARGVERYAGAQYVAESSQAYRIRYDASVAIDPTWRVMDGAERWNVTAVLPGEGRNIERIVLVQRLDPDDE